MLKRLEAPTGIEPVYTDLQSAASPLRHRATVWCAVRLINELQGLVKRGFVRVGIFHTPIRRCVQA